MADQRVRGACPHDCPDTCGLVSEVENGRIIKFYGDPDHPIRPKTSEAVTRRKITY